jgi:heme A synthase
MRPSVLLLVLLIVQVTLGAFVIWSGKQFVINSLHVMTGASVLATSLVLTLRAHRPRFAASENAGYVSSAASTGAAYAHRPELQFGHDPAQTRADA